MQLTTIKKDNDGYFLLLVVIDVMSKYAWVEPLRDKTALNVAKAFKNIVQRAEDRAPLCLQSDRGKEFMGSAFQRLLEKENIRFRVAQNLDIKAAVGERLSRKNKEVSSPVPPSL